MNKINKIVHRCNDCNARLTLGDMAYHPNYCDRCQHKLNQQAAEIFGKALLSTGNKGLDDILRLNRFPVIVDKPIEP